MPDSLGAMPDETIRPPLRTLVAGLNQIGLKPTGIIAILQAIKTAGALQAELAELGSQVWMTSADPALFAEVSDDAMFVDVVEGRLQIRKK